MSQSVMLAGLDFQSPRCSVRKCWDAEPGAAAPVRVNELVMRTLLGNQPLACEWVCEWTGECQLAKLNWTRKCCIFKGTALKPFLGLCFCFFPVSYLPQNYTFRLALCLSPPSETQSFSFRLRLMMCLPFQVHRKQAWTQRAKLTPGCAGTLLLLTWKSYLFGATVPCDITKGWF